MKNAVLSLFIILAFVCCNNEGGTTNVDDTNTSTNTNTSNYTPSPAESPEIHIQVDGMQAGKAYLIGVFADQQFGIDSALIDASGKMVFQRNEPYKPGFVFVWLPNRTSVQMMLDTDQKFSLRTNAGSIVESMQVEGSLDNELLYKHLKEQLRSQPQINGLNQQLASQVENSPEYNRIKDQRDAIIDQRKAALSKDFKAHPNTFYTKFKRAGQNPDLVEAKMPDGTIDKAYQVYMYKEQFWDNVDFRDERLLYTPVLANKLSRYITELTPQHPDSIIRSAKYIVDKSMANPETFKFFANWIALNYEPEKTTLMDPEAVHVFLVQNYFTNEHAFWADSLEVYALQKRAGEMAGSLLNKKGPDVTANDPQGNPRSIYELTAPYIVIFMYNPDCDHCQEEAPQLTPFYNEWKNKGVDIFTIALDTNEQLWKQFLQRFNIPGTHVYDPTNKAIYAKYFVNNTPEIYVLNPDRTIIAKNLKVHQIAEVIEQDMKK